MILKNRLIKKLVKSRTVRKLLVSAGYRIEKTGPGYIDPRATIAGAKAMGVSLFEYMSTKKINDGSGDRMNTIYRRLKGLDIFDECKTICEIGTGTGLHLEKSVALARPEKYEIYETNSAWSDYLRKTYESTDDCCFLFQPAGGSLLDQTADSSCDLIHAHGVFIYIPVVNTFSYIKEAARVCRSGRFILFDCFTDTSFTSKTLNSWIESGWKFPVITPEKLLLEFAASLKLELVQSFTVDYSASYVTYFLFKKK